MIFKPADSNSVSIMSPTQEKILKGLNPKTNFSNVIVYNGNLVYYTPRFEFIMLKNIDLEDGTYKLKALQNGLQAKSSKGDQCPEFLEFITANKKLNLNKEIKDFILKAVPFVSDDERPYMKGIAFCNGRISATDGKRMISKKEEELLVDLNCIISVSKGNASFLKKLFDNSSDLTFKVFDNCVRFENEEFIYQIDIIEGQFPNVERVIPEPSEDDEVFIIPPKKTLSTIKKCMQSKYLTPVVTFIDDNIVFEDEEDEEVKVEFHSSLSHSIKFNVNYLLDALDFTDKLMTKGTKQPTYFVKGNETVVIMPCV